MTYFGDGKYASKDFETNITVLKISDYSMNVSSPSVIYVGDNAIFIVDLPVDATGEVTVAIAGRNYTGEVKNGIANITVSGLIGGEHNVTVTYFGDGKYASKDFETNITVLKISDYSMNVSSPSVIYVGDNAIFIVDLPVDATGEVTVAIAGRNYTGEVKNGIANITVSGLASGEYNVSVTYFGDGKYALKENKTDITVLKVSDYVMNVTSPKVINVGDNASFIISLPTDATGVVNLTVAGRNYTGVVKNGVANITVSGLASGEYNVSINYFGNDKYYPNEAKTNITVNKVSENMNVTYPDKVKTGDNSNFIIDLPVDATGKVTITVDGKNYTGEVKNGVANITIPSLPTGEYNAVIGYSGDDKYLPSSVNKTITVVSNDVNLTSNDVAMIYKDGSRLYGILLDGLGNPIANATLSFTINGVTYNRTTNVNGTASIALNLDYGVYNAVISYIGDKVVSANATVTVNPSIIGNNLVKMWRNGTQFYADFLGVGSKPLANTNVTFNINGVFYTRQTNENGTARLNINLDPGNYTLTAYNPINGEQRGFNVLVKSLIETKDLTKYYMNESKFEVKVWNYDGTVASGKTVSFNINGVFYTRTADANGIVRLSITLRPGDYVITSMYEGLSIGNKVKVLPTLETSDLSMKFEDGSKFTVKTLDGQGNPLSNQNIIFNVNGVFYYKTTGDDGKANLNINLMSGEYIITSYWGDYEIGNKITIS